jgi:hypothetical protein
VPSMATTSNQRYERGSRFWSAPDLWLEAFVAFNFLSLSGDIALAHSENRFRVHAEYIPLWFSLLATLLMLIAIVTRMRGSRFATWVTIGQAVGWVSILVGAAGVIYHLDSQFFYERTLRSLTYAAPFAAPLSYVGLGCLLVMNRMVSPAHKEWAHWVMFFTLGGFVGNFALSLTDHASNGFFHWTEWIPVASSALAVGFLLVLLFSREDTDRSSVFPYWCVLILLLQMGVGALGFALHAWADLHGRSGTWFENMVSGAPPFAPLLLPNLSILGLIGIAAMLRKA